MIEVVIISILMIMIAKETFVTIAFFLTRDPYRRSQAR